MFFLSDTEIAQTIGEDEKQLAEHTPNGIFFPSPNLSTKMKVPAAKKIIILTIAIPKKYLNTYFASEPKQLFRRLLIQKNPIFLYENITSQIKIVIRQLLECNFTGTTKSVY